MDDPVPREEGRGLFGRSASAYDTARPDYPERVYSILVERCGLSGGRTLEVGAGSGIATRRLMQLGAHSLVAVEPDRGFSNSLGQVASEFAGRVIVVASTFESAELAQSEFDLAVCATSFHWLDPGKGPAKLGGCLRPGGWLAIFWNVFGDPDREDPFHEATRSLLAHLPTSPSHLGASGRPYALDREARRSDFVTAAADDEFAVERVAWSLSLSSDQVRALYSTFSPIARMPAQARESLLDSIALVAETRFAGHVERPMVTPVYTGRRRA